MTSLSAAVPLGRDKSTRLTQRPARFAHLQNPSSQVAVHQSCKSEERVDNQSSCGNGKSSGDEGQSESIFPTDLQSDHNIANMSAGGDGALSVTSHFVLTTADTGGCNDITNLSNECCLGNLGLLMAAAETCERLSVNQQVYDGGSKDENSALPPTSASTAGSLPLPITCNSPLPSSGTRATGSCLSNGGKNGKGKPYRPSYVKDTDTCQVCGDVATGRHYRVMACEGCKGFFRRTIQTNRQHQYQCQYQCRASSDCHLGRSGRGRCQACRIRKCLEVGMDRQLVMNEAERQAKRKLIEEKRQVRRAEEEAKRQRVEDIAQEANDEDEDDDKLIPFETTQFEAMVSAQALLPLGVSATKIAGLSQDDSDGPSSLLEDVHKLKQLLALGKARVGDMAMSLPCFSMESQHKDWRRRIVNLAYELALLEVDQFEITLASAYMLLRQDCPADQYYLKLEELALVKRLRDELLEVWMRYIIERRESEGGTCGALLRTVFHIQCMAIHDSDLILQRDDGTVFISPLLHLMFGG